MEEKDKARGILTQEEKDNALARLKERGGDKSIVCTVCRQTKWIMGDHLVTPIIFRQGGFFMGGGAAYPVIMLVCNHCGHTLYINAVMMGLVPPLKDAQEGKAEVKEEEGPNG